MGVLEGAEGFVPSSSLKQDVGNGVRCVVTFKFRPKIRGRDL